MTSSIYSYPSIKAMDQFKRQVEEKKRLAEDPSSATPIDELVTSAPVDEMSCNQLARSSDTDDVEEVQGILALDNESQVRAWAQFGLSKPGRLDAALKEISKLNNHKASDPTLVSRHANISAKALRQSAKMSPEKARGHKLGTLVALHSLSHRDPGLDELANCGGIALKALRAFTSEEEAKEFSSTVATAGSTLLRSLNRKLYESLPFSQEEPTLLLLEWTASSKGAAKAPELVHWKSEGSSLDGEVSPFEAYEKSLQTENTKEVKYPDLEFRGVWGTLAGRDYTRKPGSLQSSRQYANFLLAGDSPTWDIPRPRSGHWDVQDDVKKELATEDGPRAKIAKAIFENDRGKNGQKELTSYLHKVADDAGFKVAWKDSTMTAYQPEHALESDPAMIVEDSLQHLYPWNVHPRTEDGVVTISTDDGRIATPFNGTARAHFVPDASKARLRDADVRKEAVLSLEDFGDIRSAMTETTVAGELYGSQRNDSTADLIYKSVLEKAMWDTWKIAMRQPTLKPE